MSGRGRGKMLIKKRPKEVGSEIENGRKLKESFRSSCASPRSALLCPSSARTTRIKISITGVAFLRNFPFFAAESL